MTGFLDTTGSATGTRRGSSSVLVEEFNRDVHMPLIHYFFALIYPLTPIVHKPSFLSHLQPVNLHPPLLLSTIYSCASHLAIAYGDLPELNLTPSVADAYHAKAMRLLPSVLESEKLTSVQSLILLTTVAIFRNNISLAWMTSGMAVRMAMGLKINIDTENVENGSNFTWIERETRRRVWWSCFIMVG